MAVFPALGSIPQAVRTALLSLHNRLVAVEATADAHTTELAAGKLLVTSGSQSATGSITTTTSAADVTGATTGALALLAGDVVVVQGVFDSQNGAAGIITIGTLDINGNAQGPQALQGGNDANDRATVAQSWRYVVPSDGNYTFKLRARHSSGATGATVSQSHTTISWQVFR